MNAQKGYDSIELVTVDEITARLDLYPRHLTRTVLKTLEIRHVFTNKDDQEWYFWNDVVASLVSVAQNDNQPPPAEQTQF